MSSSVKLNLGNINKITSKLQNAGKVRVGILGSGKKRRGDSLSNVEIGRIHEFGSIQRKIPARSFLRVPLRKNTDKLLAVLEGNTLAKQALSEGNDTLALELLGVKAEAIVLKAFRNNGYGTWAKLKPNTLKNKRSNKPLIETAQLRRSITSKVVANGA